MRSLRLETAVQTATPGWEMRSPSTHAFSLDNGTVTLRSAFDDVRVIRPGAESTVE
jgi:hypothetical protein